MSLIQSIRLPGMLAMALAGLAAASCTRPPPQENSVTTANLPGCLPTGEGIFEAELRGAMEMHLAWSNAQMQCEGSPRPDGNGLRLTIAGPLATGGQLRFIFGIDLMDTASGVAQAFPTNLTVIVEGEQLLYATLGDDKCAVETLQRAPLPGSGDRLDRVKVRGYCIGPASNLTGTARLHVPTFSFTALASKGVDP